MWSQADHPRDRLQSRLPKSVILSRSFRDGWPVLSALPTQSQLSVLRSLRYFAKRGYRIAERVVWKGTSLLVPPNRNPDSRFSA